LDLGAVLVMSVCYVADVRGTRFLPHF